MRGDGKGVAFHFLIKPFGKKIREQSVHDPGVLRKISGVTAVRIDKTFSSQPRVKTEVFFFQAVRRHRLVHQYHFVENLHGIGILFDHLGRKILLF